MTLLVLAPTRGALRRAVKLVKRGLSALQLGLHPGKTFIGRIARGFDFLGYHFSPTGLTVTPPTVERFVARAAQLYEQGRAAPSGAAALGHYVRRWRGWARGGLAIAPLDLVGGPSRRPRGGPSGESGPEGRGGAG